MLDSYDIIYLLSNVFGAYTIFKFMCIFFERHETNKKVEFITYVLYYIVIGAIYITFDNPAVNLCANLIFFFLLTFNYSSTWKLRLIAVSFIYAILLYVEASVVLGLRFINLNRFTADADIELIIALLSSKMISYIVVLALSTSKMIKNEIKISPMHWLAIITIPSSTSLSTFMLITANTGYRLSLILMEISILFFINIFVFYLYDALIKSYHEKMEKELLYQQNNAYIKQFDIINRSQENIKILRHDLKNHMSVLQALIEKNDSIEALQYMHSIFNFINCGDEYVKSGNTEVDSILNYKMHEAQKRGIEVYMNLSIPEKLNIKPFDLSIVLGNLLDNAIEAASKLGKEKVIKASVELDRNILYISISNPFDGKLLYKAGKLKTTNKEKENHGFGLSSMKKAIGKYNGTINIHHTDTMFYADVLMYNPVNTFLKEKL